MGPPRNVLAVAAALALATPAAAQVEAHSTRAAFEAAAVVDVEIDFEDDEVGDEWLGSAGFRDPDSGLQVWTTDDYLVWRHGPGAANGFLYGPTSHREKLRIDLPPGTTAFGAHVATFYTRDRGTVAIGLSTGDAWVVEVNGTWISTGANPGSSFLGVVAEEPIEWVSIEALTNDDARDLGFDLPIVDDILLGIGTDGRSVCELELEACEEEVAALRELAGDEDADGESDPTDRCPDTPEGLEVDGDGCSHVQFCALFDPSVPGAAELCRMADWGNDEPLDARDCTSVKSAGVPICVPRL